MPESQLEHPFNTLEEADFAAWEKEMERQVDPPIRAPQKPFNFAKEEVGRRTLETTASNTITTTEPEITIVDDDEVLENNEE